MALSDPRKNRMLNPNFLTLSRIISLPLIVVLLMFDNRVTSFFAALLFSAASITDYLDGYLARTYGMVTQIGKILDPLADKLLISSTLIMLVSLHRVPGWMACVIIGREIAVTGLRTVLIQNEVDVSASQLGKYKVGFQVAAIIPMLLYYPYFSIDMEAIGLFFLWGALVFTVWSGMDYYKSAKKSIKVEIDE